jgi:hypothetical protein
MVLKYLRKITIKSINYLNGNQNLTKHLTPVVNWLVNGFTSYLPIIMNSSVAESGLGPELQGATFFSLL